MSLWEDNAAQFPRLIAEADAAGAFTPNVLLDMAASMDLYPSEILDLIGRATDEFDALKETLR